jgi:hypothetical protein
VEEGKGSKRVVKVHGDKTTIELGGKDQTFALDGGYFWDVKNVNDVAISCFVVQGFR